MTVMYPESFPTRLYLTNAQTSEFQRKLEEAAILIHEALGKNLSWYVAWSGGKDSTALAHLVNRIQPGIEVWCEKDDCDFPGELEYVRRVADMFVFNLNLHIPDVSLWEHIEEHGIDICEDLHSRGTVFSDEHFYAAITEQEKRHDGVFLGLRNEESNARRKNTERHGPIYQRKNGKWTCNPLYNWTGTDVFSYLVSNSIPIFDVYFKTRFVNDPAEIRKSWVLPSAQASEGQALWIKYYYPSLFNRLAQKYPELRNYV